MGDIGSDLFTTVGARTAYATGLRVFGRTYLSEATLTPDELWGNIQGTLRPLRSLLIDDPATNPDGYLVVRQMRNPGRGGTPPYDSALQEVGRKLTAMFDPNSPYPLVDRAGPLLTALTALQDEVAAVRSDMESASRKYELALNGSSRQSVAEDADARFLGAFDAAAQSFRAAGRDAAMTAAAAIEREAVAWKEPVDAMWARANLADAAARLRDRAGDLPDALRIRDSDQSVGDYLALATEGLQPVPVPPGATDARTAFAKEAGALSDPDLAERDPAGFITACSNLSNLLDEVDRAVSGELARPRGGASAGALTAGENALATSAVLCEGVRGALAMKRSSSQAPRSQQELDTAIQSRDDLARLAETSERAREADPTYDRRDPTGRR